MTREGGTSSVSCRPLPFRRRYGLPLVSFTSFMLSWRILITHGILRACDCLLH
jgi:hypothetical protein